jgi:hypothetical protein
MLLKEGTEGPNDMEWPWSEAKLEDEDIANKILFWEPILARNQGDAA